MKKIMKRNGREVQFNAAKIARAIRLANDEVKHKDRLLISDITALSERAEENFSHTRKRITVEDVQDYVENELLKIAPQVAKSFIKYREAHRSAREDSALLNSVRSINDNSNAKVGKENSNKNAKLVSTKRDLIAGEVYKAIATKDLIPADIWNAHKSGVIHIHDTDYIAGSVHNCELVNLEDMLQNGTVISGTRIDKPNSFGVACNVATQVMAVVASSTFGLR